MPVCPQPVWIGFTKDDVIGSIIKAMMRRYEILVKHGMEPYRAQQRVPRELEKSLNRLMKDFVFPEELSSECKLDDLDEDGE
jgi:hypothetical protein